MENKVQVEQQHNAGFWVRFAAFWIDGMIVWGALKVVVLVVRTCGVYVSAELFILVFGAFYWVLLTSWRGKPWAKLYAG